MKQIKIRPIDGKRIRDPRDGRVLPADRTTVVSPNSYWQRRLRDKDVEIIVVKVEKKIEKVEKSEKIIKKSEKIEKKN